MTATESVVGISSECTTKVPASIKMPCWVLYWSEFVPVFVVIKWGIFEMNDAMNNSVTILQLNKS